MLSSVVLKAAFPAAAALLVGGLLSFNLLGEGTQLSVGTSQSDELGMSIPSLPEESTMVMAQLGGAFANSQVTKENTSTSANAASITAAQAGGNGKAGNNDPSNSEPRKPVQWKTPEGKPPPGWKTVWPTSSKRRASGEIWCVRN